jgi:hypothetical protein
VIDDLQKQLQEDEKVIELKPRKGSKRKKSVAA